MAPAQHRQRNGGWRRTVSPQPAARACSTAHAASPRAHLRGAGADELGAQASKHCKQRCLQKASEQRDVAHLVGIEGGQKGSGGGQSRHNQGIPPSHASQRCTVLLRCTRASPSPAPSLSHRSELGDGKLQPQGEQEQLHAQLGHRLDLQATRGGQRRWRPRDGGWQAGQRHFTMPQCSLSAHRSTAQRCAAQQNRRSTPKQCTRSVLSGPPARSP